MRKGLVFLIAAVFAASVTLTACGTSENKPGEKANTETTDKTESTETTEIQFWHHYSAQSPENDTLMNVLIPEFEKENPGIKVNAVSHEWADLHDKVLISAKSNTLPDVARCDSAWIPEFHKMGILTELDTEMDDFKDVSSGLIESAMSTACISDHYYGLALNTNTKILFYNVDALEKAGIKAPETMEEFSEAVKKLSGKNADGQQVWGYTEPALSGWNLCPFIWSCGGEITNPEQSKASGYINSEKTIKAVEMLADMYKNSEMTGFNSGDIPMTDGFGTGRYMMLLEGPWKISELQGAYPDFKYATAPMPEGEGGSHSVLGGEDIAMLNDSHKEASWKFMKFMTSEYAQVEMSKCGQIPVNKDALETDDVKNAQFAPFIEAIKDAKSRPTVACWSEMDTELSNAMFSVMSGQKTAKDAMDELAVKLDKLLADQ